MPKLAFRLTIHRPVFFMHILLLAGIAGVATSAYADPQYFRCKNDLVQIGDTKSAVWSKCGEPVLKDSFCKKQEPQVVTSPGKRPSVVINNACDMVDEWTYNPGSGQFMTTLRFESGALVSIRYGDRVK